ncbi:hypothetical protein [Burkholderia aenigmatica]|nr:hypothetical protein [Burkholderia aenigmatica]
MMMLFDMVMTLTVQGCRCRRDPVRHDTPVFAKRFEHAAIGPAMRRRATA